MIYAGGLVVFQKANFISRSTRASFSLILLQRATALSYNEVIFFPAMHTLCSIRQGRLFKPSPVSIQSMMDSITELSKIFPQYIPLIQGHSPEHSKGTGKEALQDEDCMLINQLLYLSCLGKYCLFVNKRFTLNFLQTKEHKAGLDCIQRGRKLPAVKATEISISTVINTPSCVLKHRPSLS